MKVVIRTLIVWNLISSLTIWYLGNSIRSQQVQIQHLTEIAKNNMTSLDYVAASIKTHNESIINLSKAIGFHTQAINTLSAR